jgi:4-amino-4-deoxy-L-arabinose transferase-like glycosyltransferase
VFKRWKIPAIVISICIAIFLFRALTAANSPITWDEPVYLRASKAYMNWGRQVINDWMHGDFSRPFSEKSINSYWQRHLPSPPLAKSMNGLTWFIFKPLWGDLVSLRAGSALFYAILFGVVIWHAKLIGGWVSAAISSIALLINPRLFSHAGTANLDTIGMVFAYLSLFYFWKTKELRGWKCLLFAGLLFGLAFAAKNSALLILPVLGIWCVLWVRKWPIIIRFASLIPAAFIVLLLVWPWLWHDTGKHLYEFGQFTGLTGLWERITDPSEASNRKLTREFGARTTGILVDDERKFPWYYSIRVLTSVIPVPTLVVFAAGTLFLLLSIRNSDSGFLLLATWIPIVLTSLPIFPVYDMERFLLICFPFIALTAGYGASKIAAKVSSKKLTAAAAIAIFVISYSWTFREWRYLHPLELSYFNGFVNGLPGAVEKGFPRTYWLQGYWTALPYMNENLPDGATIGAEEHNVLVAYQEFGLLNPTLSPVPIYDRVQIVEKINFWIRQHPVNPRRQAELRNLFTFNLHDIPIVSVFRITPRYLKFVAKKERQDLREKLKESEN